MLHYLILSSFANWLTNLVYHVKTLALLLKSFMLNFKFFKLFNDYSREKFLKYWNDWYSNMIISIILQTSMKSDVIDLDCVFQSNSWIRYYAIFIYFVNTKRMFHLRNITMNILSWIFYISLHIVFKILRS